MKHLLLTTIAAVVLVGCGDKGFEGKYYFTIKDRDQLINIKSDGYVIMNEEKNGNWKIIDDLLVLEFSTDDWRGKHNYIYKFNINNFKWVYYEKNGENWTETPTWKSIMKNNYLTKITRANWQPRQSAIH